MDIESIMYVIFGMLLAYMFFKAMNKNIVIVELLQKSGCLQNCNFCLEK